MLKEEYIRLLEKGFNELPKKSGSGERFEIPKPIGVWIGNRTIVQNFNEIGDRLNRDARHVLKFLSKEMATAATLDGSRAIFQGRFTEGSIRRLLNIYAQRYVICPICKRPDTIMVKEGRYLSLKCEACGAKSPLLPT